MGESPMSLNLSSMKSKRLPGYVRPEWMTRHRRWPPHDFGVGMRCSVEWWQLDCEAFDGAWVLEDGGRSATAPALAKCVARMLVARVAGLAMRDRRRAADAGSDIIATGTYLDALRLEPVDLWSAKRVLAALQPFDPDALADALLRIASAASREGFEQSARSLARIAYAAAAGHASHRAAQAAALRLSRSAALQECPRAARRWRAIAHLHGQHADRDRWRDTVDE